MISIANRKRSLGAGSASVYLNVILVIVAAVGWYLFFEEQKQHLSTAELLSISEEAAAQLAPAQDEVEQLGQRSGELETRLRDSQDELRGVRAELAGVNEDLAGARDSLAAANRELEEARAELAARDAAIAELEQELGKERLLHDQARLSLAAEQFAHDGTRRSRGQARESLAQLRAALAAAGEDGGSSAEDSARIASLEAELADARRQGQMTSTEDKARIARLEAELATARRQQQMTSAELEEELQRRLEQQAAVDANAEATAAERRRLADELAREQARRQQLLDRIAAISSDVEAKEDALSGAQQDAQALSQQLESTRRQQDELRARLAEQEAEARHFADLKDSLERELNESRIQITQLKNRMTVINLTSEVLFSSGSARLKPAGEKVLALIAKSLNNYPRREISVEGHTDNVPIGRRSPYSSNWELSAARAMSAVSFLQRSSNVDPARLRVVGHGEHKPVAGNDTAAGRQANRRIEIRLLPAPEAG